MHFAARGQMLQHKNRLIDWGPVLSRVPFEGTSQIAVSAAYPHQPNPFQEQAFFDV